MSEGIPQVGVEELARALTVGAPLIDVREADEFAWARVSGAKLIPLQSVPERIDEIPAGQTVYVICKSGGRSAAAVEFLRGQGIDAVNVAGGTLAWIEAGYEHSTGPL